MHHAIGRFAWVCHRIPLHTSGSFESVTASDSPAEADQLQEAARSDPARESNYSMCSRPAWFPTRVPVADPEAESVSIPALRNPSQSPDPSVSPPVHRDATMSEPSEVPS